MEYSDLLIIISLVSLAIYGVQSTMMKKMDEVEAKTEELLKDVNRKLETLEEELIKRFDIFSSKFDELDMEFIDDVIKDVDAELLTAKEHQRSRQYMRELEVKRKKEAEEKRNAYVKRKNAVSAEGGITKSDD